jgi:hypothetical protein
MAADDEIVEGEVLYVQFVPGGGEVTVELTRDPVDPVGRQYQLGRTCRVTIPGYSSPCDEGVGLKEVVAWLTETRARVKLTVDPDSFVPVRAAEFVALSPEAP